MPYNETLYYLFIEPFNEENIKFALLVAFFITATLAVLHQDDKYPNKWLTYILGFIAAFITIIWPILGCAILVLLIISATRDKSGGAKR